MAKPNSASLPSESDPKLLMPTTRPHASTRGPPLLPLAMGAVCRIVSNCRELRPADTVPLDLTGVSGSIMSRSEEHTSELQSLMRISYAVFCLKKNKKSTQYSYTNFSTQKIK